MSSVNPQFSQKTSRFATMIASGASALPPLIEESIAIAILARQIEFDLKRSREILGSNAPSSIEFIRTLSSSGHIEEAERLLKELKNYQSWEKLEEQARLAAFRGEWAVAINSANQALQESDVPAISQFSLLQVIALSAFELGEYRMTETCLKRAELYSTLFPKSPLVTYLEITRLRLQIRLGRWVDIESRLQNQFSIPENSQTPNRDQLLSWVRLVLDFKRFHGLDFKIEAQTAWTLSEWLGDRTYQDLAQLDYWVSCGANRDEMPRLQSPRALRYLEEIKCQSPESLWSKETLLWLKQNASGVKPPNPSPLTPKDAIWVTPFQLRFSREKTRAESMPISDRAKKCLNEYAKGEVEKERLFQKVWGIPKYLPTLHDSAVRKTLSRINAATDLGLKTRQGRLTHAGEILIYPFQISSN